MTTQTHAGSKDAWRTLHVDQDETHVDPAEGPDTQDDTETVLLEM